jgi:hypothetical protein
MILRCIISAMTCCTQASSSSSPVFTVSSGFPGAS